MSIKGNTTEIKKCFYNGTELSKVYMNTELVFQRGVALTLVQAVTEINLAAFIAANNPDGHTSIVITNNLTQPRIVTGDLSGLEVVLINNGEIQGMSSSRTALSLTTGMSLVNNGYIRGAGGRGGNGGVGLSDTYNTVGKELEAPAWATVGSIYRKCHNATHLGWKGSYITYTGEMPVGAGPYTIGGVPNIYRGEFIHTALESPSGDSCDGTTTYWHYSERRYNVSHSRAGGLGGLGGRGDSFGVTLAFGSEGAASTPAGGNSGGTGGTGGNWGVNGSRGNKGVGQVTNNGVAGETAGFAIKGSSFLIPGSITGSVNGLIEPTPE